MSTGRTNQAIAALPGMIATLLLVIAAGAIWLLRQPAVSRAGPPAPSRAAVPAGRRLVGGELSRGPQGRVPNVIVVQQEPEEETAAGGDEILIRQAILAALPGAVQDVLLQASLQASSQESPEATRLPVRVTVRNVSISQTSPTRAVGLINYTINRDMGSDEFAAWFALRKLDTGWQIERMERE